MADARFFDREGPFALKEIASATNARPPDEADLGRVFDDVAPIGDGAPGYISFLENPKYLRAFRESAAGACFVSEDNAKKAPETMLPLITPTPYRAYALAARLFYPITDEPPSTEAVAWDPTAKIGDGCTIAPSATIGRNAEIGEGTQIGHGATIGRGVVLGRECVVHSGVTITHSLIGDHVEILPGARIGQDGFGFAPDPPGYVKVPQLGRVIIGDNVSIGANTAVDRGSGPDTVIGADTRIDNLVQIAHNVVLGRGCVLAAQIGISGSTNVGDYVVMGGQVGLAGHLTIASGVMLAAKSGVTRDLREAGQYGGFPAVPIREWRRRVAYQSRSAKKDGEHG